MRQVNSKSEVVGRYGPRKTVYEPFPGHTGPRPQLSFVLKTLAGDESGMVRMHISCTPGFTPEQQELFDAVFSDPKSLLLAEANMIQRMKLLADLWIDSGKSGPEQSVDNPASRNVEFAPEDRPIPISRLFYSLIGVEPRYPVIRSDGTQTTEEYIFGFDVDSITNHGVKSALTHFGQKVAMYWFARLLNSPFSRHLARCDKCEAYFAYERAPKTAIKSGVYCAKCKGRGASLRMKSARAMLQRNMVDVAANVWGEWKSSHRTPDQRDWVAKQVSKRFGPRLKAPLTRKWVSQNLDSIETAIKRSNDAARKS
jgi:hypothetical protein